MGILIDPATNTLLQAIGDLDGVNWINVAITLTVTNLLNQVLISSSPGSAFFRLKGP